METTEKYYYEQYAQDQYIRTANGHKEETFVEWRNRRQTERVENNCEAS